MHTPIHHMQQEADVGSGEKGPAELETEKMIEQIGGAPSAGKTRQQQAEQPRGDGEGDDKYLPGEECPT